MTQKIWTDSARKAALDALGPPSEDHDSDLDDLAKLAAEICDTPVAMVNLVYIDQQFSKSHIGTDIKWLPTEQTFCQFTIQQDMMIVNDATQDDRFKDNPLVKNDPNFRFYAGMTLRNSDNVPLGAFCVMDAKPRTLTDFQLKALKTLSTQAMRLLDLKRVVRERAQAAVLHTMIIDSAIDYAIIATDLAGNIQSWNTGAEQIFGWPADEAIGLHIDEIFTHEDEKKNRSEHEMSKAIENGSANDMRWHVRKNGEKFWATGRMMPLMNPSDKVGGFLKIVRDQTEPHLLKQERENLNQEILHRLKNSMTVVQSLAQQSIKSASSLSEASDNVSARLSSYANAHSLLLQNNWREASIKRIFQEAFAPHEALLSQITMQGPDILIPSRRVIGLTLALHELITNAIKYGSLSIPTGKVNIIWEVNNESEFQFTWHEIGGPAVIKPKRKGFGSTILRSITSRYFSGQSVLDYDSNGFRYELTGTVSE